jgi:protein SCO1/2
MSRNNRYPFVLLGLLLLAMALVYSASAQHRWGANYFPNIELTTQDGKTVHFYDDLIKGKTVGINLIYTHCEYACPLETARLVQVQKILGDQMGKDIFFYSISIDPKNDTPPVMKAYMESYHVGPGWTFLTGKKDDIDFLSKKLGLYSDPKESRDGHTPHLLIGNEPMGQWMRTSAIDNPAFLARTITDVRDIGKYRNPTGEKNYAEAAAMKFDAGQYLFARHCAACHSIGHGDKIGPDLMGVADARNRDWLVHMIERPQELLHDKDPLATAEFEKYNHVVMPDLSMGREATEALIRFLVTQSSVEARRLASATAENPRGEKSAAPPSQSAK